MSGFGALLKNLSLSSIGRSFDGGNFWSVPHLLSAPIGDREQIEADFEGYIQGAYKANGIVFACILARLAVFSQARFMFQEFEDHRPGDLFGNDDLTLLERPWENGTTGELLAHMEQDGSLAGNFFGTVRGQGTDRRIRRLRPDWVTIITGSPTDDPFDLDAKVIGYLYKPKGHLGVSQAQLLTPGEVVHWSPTPDPEAQWRGMSWVTPVVREIMGDNAATKHKLKFFENGAVSNMVVTYDPGVSPDNVKTFAEMFKEQHAGVDKAYRTVHLGGGADAKMMAANLKELDFKAVQGGGETRIAAASGVGSIIAQFSEGMQGSSLNAGNYGAARRRFGDITMQHLWQTAAAALAKFAPAPSGARLWFDARDIPFLQEDQKDAAEILGKNASTIASLVKEGFTADSATKAVMAGDLGLLVHSGLVSVQLQAPGANSNTVDAPAGDVTPAA